MRVQMTALYKYYSHTIYSHSGLLLSRLSHLSGNSARRRGGTGASEARGEEIVQGRGGNEGLKLGIMGLLSSVYGVQLADLNRPILLVRNILVSVPPRNKRRSLSV